MAASRSFAVRIISCSNIPWGNQLLKNCDPYCRVFLDGTIKACLGQTPYHPDIPDVVEWGNAGQMYFNPVRGLRLYFELFDKEKLALDQFLGSGVYDPNFDGATNTVISIPLITVPKFKKKRENEPTILKFAFNYTPSPIPSSYTAPSAQQNPLYLTVGTKNPILPGIPFSQSLPPDIRGIIPFRFPYELSVSLFQESETEFTVLHSGNRIAAGALHSGLHPCACDRGLSQSVRLDPTLLYGGGFRKFIVALTSPTYAPLEHSVGEIVTLFIWSSNEKSKDFTGEESRLDIVDRQDLTLAAQIPVPAVAPASVVALASGEVTKVRTSCQIEFRQGGISLPTAQFANSFQTAGQAIPVLTGALHVTKSRPPESYDFPLLVPKALPAIVGLNPSIKASAQGFKGHYLAAHALDVKLGALWSCSQAQVSPATGVSFKSTETSIVVELSRLSSEVAIILFTIHGAKPFSEEGKIDPTKNKFDVVAQQTLPLFVTRYKRTQRKNGLLWFALSRDGFGSWALTYARISINTPDQNQVVAAFASTLRTILNW